MNKTDENLCSHRACTQAGGVVTKLKRQKESSVPLLVMGTKEKTKAQEGGDVPRKPVKTSQRRNQNHLS